MRTIRINTSKPYNVFVGRGLLQQLPSFLTDYPTTTKMMIVCGSNVSRLYLPQVKTALEEAGYPVYYFIFPAGENSKTLQTVEHLYTAMANADITRTDLVIALGGGVTGDIAGFAAATFLRGISFIQVPTTLLAAVDSSVGGKTGVNIPQGKNLAGAFHQPSLVVCDLNTFDSLPEEILNDGTSEAIKYGVIWDKELFKLLAEGHRDRCMDKIVSRCIEIKGEIVSQDEQEKGIRILLNYGHTLAHGIEMDSRHRISHGQAVAIGMAEIARLQQTLEPDSEDITQQLTDCLHRYHLPTVYEGSLLSAAQYIAKDKKRSGNSIRLVLSQGIGKAHTISIDTEHFIQLCKS